MKNKKITFVLVFLILLSLTLLYIYNVRNLRVAQMDNDIQVDELNNTEDIIENKSKEIKPLEIYTGNDRPIAIAIDNERPAWPHSGLQDAYMIYEMIIEGGETRMLAMFKNKETSKIGPIRSTRHYFVHYVMEHNAIFAHFGWSPKAQSTIRNYKVNNINGIFDTYFWRVGGGYHNAFSSISKINQMAKSKKYKTTGDDKPIYKYDTEEIEFEKGTKITEVKLKYSNLHNVSYKYDSDKKVFYRSMRGVAHKDRETKKQYYAKNIIVMYVTNYTLADGDTKGRQELQNIGTGKGYYITNGEYIDITWKKESATAKTLWFDENNNEIVLNDGLTFVQLVPSNNKVDFKRLEEISVDKTE